MPNFSNIKGKISGGVDFVDISFVIVNFMSWILIANAWKDPLASTMLSIAGVAFTVYLVSRYTGALSFIELTKPFWTLSALFSIPIWIGTFVLLPQPKGTLEASGIIPNMLEYFVSPEILTSWIQGWGFSVTEGIIAGILLSFFIGVGLKQANSSKKKKLNVVAAILLIAIFMSIIHVSFAAKLAQAGVFEPGVLFGHQFLSFSIMLIIAVFFPMVGMVALLAPHIVKNLLAFNAPTEVWVATFAIFILLDILSWLTAKRKERKAIKKTFNAFAV